MRILLDNIDFDIGSFDYNQAANVFYLSDDKSNKVFKSVYDSIGPLRLVPVISSNIQGPISLAIDWISEKIYLLEKTVNRIDVFTLNGENRTNLITSDINTPTAIVLDPNEGFLFLTDSGTRSQKPKIERILTDGTERQVIVKDKLLEPTGICLDLVKKRIIWIDRKYDHLETSDYYGAKRFILASGSRNMPHSLSVDLFESTLFYADTTKLAVMKLRRHVIYTEANITYHYKSIEQPKFVKVFHGTKQPKNRANPCSVNNGGCEHVCLLSHLDAGSNVNAFRCKCKIGYELKRDMKGCDRVRNSLYLSQSKIIRGISLEINERSETRTPILVSKMGMARGFDVDCRRNLTFYYDVSRRAIFQNKFTGDETPDASSSTVFGKFFCLMSYLMLGEAF